MALVCQCGRVLHVKTDWSDIERAEIVEEYDEAKATRQGNAVLLKYGIGKVTVNRWRKQRDAGQLDL